MNGDEVRDTPFSRCRWANDGGTPDGAAFFGGALADPAWGYNAADVDDLLRRVAEELDAGHPAGPLIENATFRRRLRSPRYDIDAVDWFLGQLLLHPDPTEPPGISADPWRDLAVAQLTQGGDSYTAKPSAMQPRGQFKWWPRPRESWVRLLTPAPGGTLLALVVSVPLDGSGAMKVGTCPHEAIETVNEGECGDAVIAACRAIDAMGTRSASEEHRQHPVRLAIAGSAALPSPARPARPGEPARAW